MTYEKKVKAKKANKWKERNKKELEKNIYKLDITYNRDN